MTSGGMVALGDSITNGKTRTVAGVEGKSWTAWLAESAGLTYSQHAHGGATSSQIVSDLLPNVSGRYKVGAFNMGTNDALQGLDSELLRRNARTVAVALTACCEKVFVLDVPYSAEASAIIREVAGEYGLAVVESQLSGPLLFQPDGVHPTAVGQLEIADRAAALLDVPPPSAKVAVGKLGIPYFARYGIRWAKFKVKALVKAAR